MIGLLVLCREFLQCFAAGKHGAWEHHLSVCLRYFCINILNIMLMCGNLNVLMYRKLFSHQVSVQQVCNDPTLNCFLSFVELQEVVSLKNFYFFFYSSPYLGLVHISRQITHLGLF